MGIRLSEVQRNSRTIKVPIGVDGSMVVEVTYRPQALTAVREDEFQKLISEDQYTTASVAFILDVMSKWDLLDDDNEDGSEKMLPINEHTLTAVIPSTFLRKILTDIFQDMYPKEESVSSFAGIS